MIDNRAAINDGSQTNKCAWVNNSSGHNNRSLLHAGGLGNSSAWMNRADHFKAPRLAPGKEFLPNLIAPNTHCDNGGFFGCLDSSLIFATKDLRAHDRKTYYSRPYHTLVIIDKTCDM